MLPIKIGVGLTVEALTEITGLGSRDNCREQGLSRNIKGAHFAVGFDCSYHHLPKGAPL